MQGIARLLFTKYVFAFEVTSALLITAAVGAMVLAHIERRKEDRIGPAATGCGPGSRPATTRARRPGPGVFATSDSVATPARLPDGRLTERSISADPADARADRRPRPRRRGPREGRATMQPDYYLVLAAVLFTIGAVGVLIRRNAIVLFMCIELMLNAANLTLVTFSRINGDLDGQIMAFFVMVVAAAEVVVGLAIIMSIFRTRRSASVDDANLLKY